MENTFKNNEQWKNSIIKNAELSRLRRLENIKNYNLNPNHCRYCKNILEYDKRHHKYCNHICSGYHYNSKDIHVNIIQRPEKKVIYCPNCLSIITTSKKYCNKVCQKDFKYKNSINEWLINPEKIETPQKYIKRWLIETYGNECYICKWKERHLITGNIPIEMHHKDGNLKNNFPENLILLCPNCHSLTHNFRFCNKGYNKIL